MTDMLSRPVGGIEGLTPPQALEAERSVLAALMLGQDAIGRAVETLQPEAFYRTSHQKIYQAIVALYNRNEQVDVITLAEELRKRSDLEAVGGPAALAQILEYATTTANLDQHIKLIHSKNILRGLIKATGEIQQEAYAASDETPEILDRAEARIFAITDSRVREGFIALKELLKPAFEHIQLLFERKVQVTGVDTGYDDINKMTAGFQNSDLIIIAGRPSMGKCLPGWTRIDDPNTGERITLEQFVRERRPRVLGINRHGRVRPTRVSDWVDSGIKPCFRVSTRLGREVEVTGHHPFLTVKGWTPLHDLSVGHKIAVPRRLPLDGGDYSWSYEKVRSLAIELMDNMTPETDLPEYLYRWDRTRIAVFLRTLFSCDGTVYAMGGQPRIEFTVASEPLARSVHHLLCRLGVIAKFWRKTERSWRVEITEPESVREYYKMIGFEGEKAKRFRIYPSDPVRGSNVGHAPPETWELVRAAASERGMGMMDMARVAGEPVGRGFNLHTTRGVPRHRLAAYAEALRSPRLRMLSSPDLYWDEIVSIEPIGAHQVYDLTVPDGANFIAQDVCVHNTSWALNIAENAAIRGRTPVAVFSLEMSKEQLVQRLLCSQAEVPLHRLRNGFLSNEDWPRLTTAAGLLTQAPIMIDDSSALTVMEIRAKCRRLKAEGKLGMLIIDYLQLIRGSGPTENRVQEISQITRNLKSLAKELNVPVVALSQLSRQVETRDKTGRPQLSDLRESGCLTADTRVQRADNGQEVSMGELLESGQRNIPVWTMDDDLRITRGVMTHVFPSGVKEVFELRLASGKTVKASANHPFYTVDGWRPVDQLAVGTRLATPRVAPSPLEPARWKDDEIVLLAHLIGDGCFAPRQPLHYTSSDPENLAVVAAAASSFGVEARKVQQGNWWHLYLPAPFRLTHGKRNPICEWLGSLGLYGKRSYEKFVPKEVFGLELSQVALFIRHLWATDGSLHLGKSQIPSIYYSSTSRRLIEDVQSLLLRFGIVARIKVTRKGGHRPCYQLHIMGSEHQTTFVDKIGVHGARAKWMAPIVDHHAGVRPNPNVDLIPLQVWGQVRRQMRSTGVTTRAFAASLGTAYCGSTLFKHAPSRERLGRVASLLQEPALQRLAQSDVFWDEIVSITPLGPQPVFDATVLGTHNFIANGIFAHNSIEQDADVVMFVYREVVYNRETPEPGKAQIIIAKQRNGPTGDVDLTFLRECTKFVPYSPMMPGEAEPSF